MSKQGPSTVNRRAFLARGAALIVGATALSSNLAACASSGTAPAATGTPVAKSSGFNWKRFDGQAVSVWVSESENFAGWLAKSGNAEFESLTGVKVSLERTSIDNYRTKQPVELAAKSSAFDVMVSQTVVEGRKYAQAGWYEPLDNYLKNPELTVAGWDFEDILPGVRASMTIGGKIVNIMYEAQTILLYMHKPLFDKFGVKVPNTFEELEQAAKAIHLKEDGVYGIGLRGGGYQMTTPFSCFLYGYGGSWLTKDSKPALTTPQALKAFEDYGRIGRTYGPPGAATFTYPGTLEAWLQGKLGMMLETNSLTISVENPEKSKMAGKTSYAVVPGGPAGRKPFAAGSGLCINPFSKKKELAWLFIQWAINKENQLKLKLGGTASSRASAWESPEFKKSDTMPALTQANVESLKLAHSEMNPPLVSALEARKIIGNVGDYVLGNNVTAEQVKAAAEKANAEMEELIKKTEG